MKQPIPHDTRSPYIQKHVILSCDVAEHVIMRHPQCSGQNVIYVYIENYLVVPQGYTYFLLYSATVSRYYEVHGPQRSASKTSFPGGS